nr:uncharacterized protein LOC127336421 [Lolium perenne]
MPTLGARPVSSSPPGLHMPRPPLKLKSWKGPLPSRRVTPPAILADFIVKAKEGSGGHGGVAVEPSQAPVMEEKAGSSSTPALASAAPIRPLFEADEAGVEAGSAGRRSGPQARWAGLCRALMGLQRADRRNLATSRSCVVSRFHTPRLVQDHRAAAGSHTHAVDRAPASPRPSPTRPLPYGSSRGGTASRSFADVVAGSSTSAGMARPQRPPVTTGVPAAAPGAAPAAPMVAPPSVPVAAAGFQGWPAGMPMPPPAASAPRPTAGFQPPRMSIPQMPFMPQQPYQQYQGHYQYPQPQQILVQPQLQQAPHQQPQPQPGQLKKRRKKKSANAVGAHPTIRCPILKLPRPTSSFVGCGNDATLDLQLPDSVYKPQLMASGAPTTLVQVSGEGVVTAADIQNLMAPEDLSRIDGMQMSVPKINAHALVSSWDGGDDDGSHGFEEERFDDAAADAAPEAASMDVDGLPPTHSSSATVVLVAEVALTPFNLSPRTNRGREILARARLESPPLVISPSALSRASSPSRVRTFMQGRTRPASSPSSCADSPTSQQGAPIPSSTSTQTGLEHGRAALQPMAPLFPTSLSPQEDDSAGQQRPASGLQQSAIASSQEADEAVQQPDTPSSQPRQQPTPCSQTQQPTTASVQPQQLATPHSQPQWSATSHPRMQQQGTVPTATASTGLGPLHPSCGE